MSKLYPPPSRCLRSHANAVRAKWAAHLMLRIVGNDPDAPLYGRNSRSVLSMRHVAERLKAICYAGTPEGTIEVAGHQLGPESIFNLYQHVATIYPVAQQHDDFPWRDVAYIIGDRPHLSFGQMSYDAFTTYGFTWQERERLRLAANVYKDVPWDLPPIEGHFAHISIKDQGVIAFTEAEDKGARDIQTPMKAGRYLKKFYQYLSDPQIEELQALIFKDDDIRISQDPDEIEKAYVTGPQSCMSGDASRWGGKVVMHPARAYGDGDLALAYMANKKGKCSARAVVWPAKKVWFRSYGDTKLIAGLEKLGYRRGSDFCFQDARIKRIKNGGGNSIICPHIDGNQRFSIVDDDFVAVDYNGPYHPPAGGAGYMNLPAVLVCACGCGGKLTSDAMYVVNIRLPETRRQRWIPECVKPGFQARRLERCGYDSQYYTPEHMADFYSSRTTKRKYCTRVAERLGFKCASDGFFYSAEEFKSHIDLVGRIWELENYRQHLKTHKQLDNGTWVPRESNAA